MMDKDKMEYDIYFSRIAGELSTYKVSDDSTVMAAGEHSHRYTFFRIPDKLKKYLHSGWIIQNPVQNHLYPKANFHS